jgi:glycosyltransferase involved in cell wall biosynthesis
MQTDAHGQLNVAIVAPSSRILGGQAVQAERLLSGWHNDDDVRAWLVPTNPVPRGILGVGLRIKYVRTAVTQLAFWPLLFREITRADVVHAFSASYSSFVISTLPAVIVSRLLRRPVIVHYHSGEAPDHLRRSTLARAALRGWTDANVVPSSFLEEVFSRHGLECRVIPNNVDLTRFTYRPRSIIRPRFVSTRNFEAHYDVASTLRAFALIQQRYPGAELTLVGGGSTEPALTQLAVELGLRNVRFTGRVRPDDIWKYYADADVYVQTPVVDNMPLSVLEAFASGTPVVSTDAGGVPAMLKHGVHGLLAPAGNPSAIAAQALRLIDEPGLGLRLAEAAHAACAAYTWNTVRPQWLALYRDLTRPSAALAANAV